MKPQVERVRECLELRRQWASSIGTPVPEDLVAIMNDYVRDGQAYSGKLPFLGRHLEIQFAAKPGRETYIRLHQN
jgi:hypothetical protein